MNRRRIAPGADFHPDQPVVAFAVAAAVVAVGLASFYISFLGLVDVASWMLVPENARWTVPVALDGTIVVYSLAGLVRHARGQRTRFALTMAGVGAVISSAANVSHILLAGNENIVIQRGIGASLAGLSAFLVLASVHQLADLAVATPRVVVPRKPAEQVVVEVLTPASPARERIAPKPAPKRAAPKFTSAPTPAPQATDATPDATAEFVPVADRVAQKTAVLRMHSEGIHERIIATETGVSLTSTRRWISQAKTQVAAA